MQSSRGLASTVGERLSRWASPGQRSQPRPSGLRRFVAIAAAVATTATGLLLTGTPVPASAQPSQITGTVFRDFNADGCMSSGDKSSATDTPVDGVAVAAFNAAGAQVGVATTGADGKYTLPVNPAQDVRVQFTAPAGFGVGPAATSACTTVAGGSPTAFPTESAPTANLALTVAGDYCQNAPMLTVPCQRSGHVRTAGNPPSDPNDAALYGVGYLVEGDIGQVAPQRLKLATQAQIGSTWGQATYDDSYVLTGALFKRHSRVGPGGTGAVYLTDVAQAKAGTANATQFVTIPNAGSDPRPAGMTDWFHDSAAAAPVGKIGLGGVELSPDQRTLYVVNLNDRRLYIVPVTAGSPPTAGTARSVALPLDLPGADQRCATTQVRPFGLHAAGTSVWVTLTCTGPQRTDLQGYVYRMNAATEAFDAKPALSFPLDYTRQCHYFEADLKLCTPGDFQPWTDTLAQDPGGQYARFKPTQPLLSDLTFDSNGDMTVAIKDRTGDQTGSFFGTTDPASDQIVQGMAAGDVLRACGNAAAGWKLESNGSCGSRTGAGSGNEQGPGGGEFYYDEFRLQGTAAQPTSGHRQIELGATLQVPGFPQVLNTLYDPMVSRENDPDWKRVNANGWQKQNNSDGTFAGPTTLTWLAPDPALAEQDASSMGKAGGLGELEALCAAAPVQIGNRVWYDRDNDGIQDPGEPPIPGVTVTLTSGGTTVGTTTTNANGEYQFTTRVRPNTQYKVTFNPDTADTSKLPGTPPADSLTFAEPKAGDNPSLDSDPNKEGVAELTTGSAGSVNQQIDAGIRAACSAGDFVWLDADRNGVQDSGEIGLAGVQVALLNANGTPASGADGRPVAPITTTDTGKYRFTGLNCAEYIVRWTLPPGAPGYSFTKVKTDDDTSVDSDATPGTTGLIGQSEPFKLTSQNPQNLTIDAGVVTRQLCTVGDFVWRDTDRDGVQDAGEPGVGGVEVSLLNPDGSPATDVGGRTIAAVTTSDAGAYRFARVPCARYMIRYKLPAGNEDVFTLPRAGGVPARDSNPAPTPENPKVGQTPVFVLAPDHPEDLTVDAGVTTVRRCSLGDFVWRDTNRNGAQDAGEPGVAGVKVTVVNANGSPGRDIDGTPIPAVTTGADGKYTVAGVPCGRYAARFTLPDDSRDMFTRPRAGDNAAKDSNPGPTSSPKVGQTPVFTLNPESPNSETSIDAGVVPAKNRLGDLVWVDRNGNAVQDRGEPGVPGTNARLLDGAGKALDTNGDGRPDTAIADRAGRYLFPSLPNGTYRVQFRLPARYSVCGFVLANHGGNDARDSDADPSSWITHSVVLGPDKRQDLTVDAGVCERNALGDRIWVDKDRDGIQDQGEPGLPGVKVLLLDAYGKPADRDGDGKPDSETTDKAGWYQFTGLPDGTYRVKIDLSGVPERYSDCGLTKSNAGGDAVDSDADTGSGITDKVVLTENRANVRTLDAGVCDERSDLADTGSSMSMPVIGLGAMALLLGIGLLVRSRRRRV